MTAVVFDVGETLADETRNCEEAAVACGVAGLTQVARVGAVAELPEALERA